MRRPVQPRARLADRLPIESCTIEGRKMLLQDRSSKPILVKRNRRAYPRLAADQLPWLRRAHLACGPAVSLIDLSVHGAFFEVDYRLRCGDSTNLELVAEDDRQTVVGHILRTEVSGLSADGVRYRGACEFERPLSWERRLSAPAPPVDASCIQPTDYQPWRGWSEVRVIFRHGHRLHGYGRGFHPSEFTLNLWPSRVASDRERQTVPLSLIRTIVFVRDFDDDGRAVESERPDMRSLHHVEVTFKNGDVVRGATPGYDPEQVGFWILPMDAGEQARVFAVRSAVREICFS